MTILHHIGWKCIKKLKMKRYTGSYYELSVKVKCYTNTFKISKFYSLTSINDSLIIICQISGNRGCFYEFCRNIKISRGDKIIQRGIKTFCFMSFSWISN